jgi:hypothetical protein
MLIFLATIMPLDERSGVNLTGALNTSHSTPVEDVPEVAPAPPPHIPALRTPPLVSPARCCTSHSTPVEDVP